ncbi:extracellular ligand-gated ion channel [Aureococcus anophagefferens]|nr:extracellular ligand-gated ion channel [Aureococcus anophagefferens]
MISQIQYRVKIPDVPRPIWLNAYLGGSIYFIMACLLEYSLLAPARVTFDAHAKGGELGVGDVKRALVDFGIYFSRAQTDRAVRIVVPASKANRVLDFEGDEGDGDDAPAKVRTFATFVLVLSAIEGHQQRAFSATSTSLADEPRSKQIDEVAFACYFPAYLVFLAIMFARIDSYSG